MCIRDSIWNHLGTSWMHFSCFRSKMTQKWPQSWSYLDRCRADGRKWWSPSDFSWFETLGTKKLLFLEVVLMMKTLGWRRKKTVTRGPPKIARRAPLRGRWRRVLRTTWFTNDQGSRAPSKREPLLWFSTPRRSFSGSKRENFWFFKILKNMISQCSKIDLSSFWNHFESCGYFLNAFFVFSIQNDPKMTPKVVVCQ